MIRKLRLKFVAVNMGIVAVMLCVMFGLVFYFTSANLERQSLAMMRQIAADPFRQMVPLESGENVRLPFFTLQLGPYGELAGTSGGFYDLSDDGVLNSLIDAATQSPREFGVLGDYNLRYYRVETPASHFVVFSDISSERSTLDGLVQTCLVISGVSLFAFLGISVLLSKWAVRPVEEAWRQQRQFVACASHELKTPLTIIMTSAELMQDQDCGEAKRERFLDGILVMSRQMRRLIEQMLELARAENTDSRTVFRPVDFTGLVERTALCLETVFFEKGLHLATKAEAGITVEGEEASLRQVLEILLDNAAKYTRPGGGARIALCRQGKRCLLTVASEGEPMSAEEQRNIFRRFYRGDAAKNGAEGFGLGLSIARTLVERHRGHIRSESRGGENIFTVELPCLDG